MEAVSNRQARYLLYCYIEEHLLKKTEVVDVCLARLVRGLFPTDDGPYLTPESTLPPCQGRVPMRAVIVID